MSLFPLLYTMIQTANEAKPFSNLVRIELGDAYLGPAAATLLAEVCFASPPLLLASRLLPLDSHARYFVYLAVIVALLEFSVDLLTYGWVFFFVVFFFFFFVTLGIDPLPPQAHFPHSH